MNNPINILNPSLHDSLLKLKIHQIQSDSKRYFWRTTQQQEIDYIEERDRVISAFEFKWNDQAKKKIPQTFLKAYPDATTNLIHTGNYMGFVLP